jgi:hypothetical protein
LGNEKMKLLGLKFPNLKFHKRLSLFSQKNEVDIRAEKIEIIRRFEQINDAELIQAIKDLLDFKPSAPDEALESVIDHSLKQSEAKKVKPHKEVMANIRKRLQQEFLHSVDS